MDFTFPPLVGIVVAGLLGGTIGLQRQAAHKPAGFRTHLIVATASAAFTAMGAHLHDTRIPSYIVVGIGFLGAGAIIRDGGTTRGLTTAATIWMAAAVGLELGYSNSFGFFAGLLITAITLLTLSISDTELMKFFRVTQKATFTVSCDERQTPLAEVSQAVRDAGLRIETCSIYAYSNEDGPEIMEIVYGVDVKPGDDISRVVRAVSALPGVRRVAAKEPLATT